MNVNDLISDMLTDFYGLRELEGDGSNPYILRIINWAIPAATDDSKVAWCAISLSYMLDLYCGPFSPIKAAREFLKVGMKVDSPKFGDIVVYWRESVNSWKGHVGIVIRVDDNGDIWTLGGNQDNQFNIKPYRPGRVLGYRRLKI